MKIFTLILIATVISLGITTMALADITLSVDASISGGTSLGTPQLMKCRGYKVTDPATFDPWAAGNCDPPVPVGTTASLDFGSLINHLLDTSGADTGVGADCFYGSDFYVLNFYPDAWGGKGYQLAQKSATIPDTDIGNALVFTPVYSEDDKFKWTGGEAEQGELNSDEISWNPQLNQDALAKAPANSGLIMKAKRARIVRAQYGIPPKPKTGQTRPANWAAIPVTKTAGDYSASIVISFTELE